MANTSFLPEDYVERKIQRRTSLFSLVLFTLVMGGVIAAYMVTDRQRAEARATLEGMNAKYAEAARRIEQLDQLQQRKQRMMQKAKVTAVLVERVPRPLIFSELINNMPISMGLLEVELATRVLPPKIVPQTAIDKAKLDAAQAAQHSLAGPEVEIKPTETTLQIIGVGPTDVTVAQFMTTLGKSPIFNDVNLAYSEEINLDGQALRKFRIEMTLNPQIDVQKIEPLMVKRELKQNPMAGTLNFDHGKATGTLDSKPKPQAVPAVNR
ncbi:MAG: PilN domain-containing protein [Planctomycetota bacterium]|nr:PilN domain-containing protein [Planctomycetota bacterium]